MGLGVGWGPKCAFYSLGRPGRRAGESHIVPKGLDGNGQCVSP